MNVVSDQYLSSNILIVDDEPIQLDSLKELMSLSGYQVETAINGNNAIELLHKYSFDTILLDLNMPDGSGFDVIDHIISNEIPVKIIVVSGQSDFESTRSALKRGAYDFIKKPYAPDELLTTVKNATNKKQLENTNRPTQQKLDET